MMVSLIQSNYMGFGSGVVVPGTGISLQNRGAGFSLEPGHPNEVGGGKRPFHTIIPGFLTQRRRAAMSFGVMGGHPAAGPRADAGAAARLPQNPQAALDAPRWKVNGGVVGRPRGDVRARLRAGLAALGHQLESIADSYMDFGAGQFIVRTRRRLRRRLRPAPRRPGRRF